MVANIMALGDDKLMFGGTTVVVQVPINTPMESCAEDETTIKVTSEKEFELYLQTPWIHLQVVDGKYTNSLP